MSLAIYPFKVDPLTLEYQNQTKNIPVGSKFPNQNLRQIGILVLEIHLDKQKQRTRDYNFIYIK